MKKKLTWLLCLIVVMSLAVHVLAAESVSVSLKASSTSISSGDEVTVTVSAEVDSCGSGGIEVSYNSKIFEVVSGEWLLSDTFFDDFDASSKDGVFVFEENAAISGKVFKLVLKVKDGAALGGSEISVKFKADGKTAEKSVGVTIACRHTYTDSCDTTCNNCGTTREIEHTWDKGKVTTEPTCTKEGVKTYTCTVCGETKTDSVAAAGHSYDSGKVTTEPTCTEKGVKTYTCTICGGTKTKSVDLAEHTYSNSCDTTCNECGATRQIEHSWDNGKITSGSTCTEKGVKTYTCTVCGETKEKSVDRIDHEYDNSCDTTCNNCGAEREITHTFTWKSMGSMHWQLCEVCGVIENRGTHTLSGELSHDDANHGYLCTVCGGIGNAQPHSFVNDCDAVCDDCGYQRSADHEYSERWSANEEGHWHECTVCGDQLEMELHIPGEEATEETDQSCTVCGYILQIAGNHSHSMAGDWLCDENGHWFLCACGTYTEAEAHAWNDGSTDAESGVITYQCTVCGYEKTEQYVPETGATQPETEATQPETQPQTQPSTQPSTQPETQPSGEDPRKPALVIGPFAFDTFPWWIILAVLLLISVSFNIYLLICLFSSKKTGKYEVKWEAAPEPQAESPEAPQETEELPELTAEDILNEMELSDAPEETE